MPSPMQAAGNPDIWNLSKTHDLVDIGLRHSEDLARQLAEGWRKMYPGFRVRVIRALVKVDSARMLVWMVTLRKQKEVR